MIKKKRKDSAESTFILVSNIDLSRCLLKELLIVRLILLDFLQECFRMHSFEIIFHLHIRR